MAKNPDWARTIVPLFITAGLAAIIALAAWSLLKTTEVDKSLVAEKAVNDAEHKAFDAADGRLGELLIEQKVLFREQQQMIQKVDKTVTRIEAKIEP